MIDKRCDKIGMSAMLILINNMRGRKPFRIPQIPKRRTYLQPLAMIKINIEAVAGVEPHKEVPVAKLHEEVDLVKAQNTVQVIVIGNQEEVAYPKDVTQEKEAHLKEEEEALLKDAVQE